MGKADVADGENCKSFKNIKNPPWSSLPCHVAFLPNLLACVPHVTTTTMLISQISTRKPKIPQISTRNPNYKKQSSPPPTQLFLEA